MDSNLLDALQAVPNVELVLYGMVAALLFSSLLIACVGVLRARCSARFHHDDARDPTIRLPFRAQRIRPWHVGIAAMMAASVALVQLAARVLDLPISSGDRALRYVLQFLPVLLLALRATRAHDAPTAIVRSLREGTILGALACGGWVTLLSGELSKELPYALLLGAVAGFCAGLVLSIVAGAAAHFEHANTHDAIERTQAVCALWLLGVGLLSVATLGWRGASNDRVVCIFPFVGSALFAIPGLIRDLARRSWIESVRSGRESGWRLTWRTIGSDAHEHLAAMRGSRDDMDGVIEWQPPHSSTPFRGVPTVPLALASLRPAGSPLFEGRVLLASFALIAALGGGFASLAHFFAAL